MELRSAKRADSAAEAQGSDFAAAVEQAKLEALYQFAYGLSHEINNPLANIATRAQTLLVEEPDPQRRRALGSIVQQAFRAHEMIADLMLFARPPALHRAATDLVQLAKAVVSELAPVAQEQGTCLSCVGAEGPLIATVDPTQIGVALKALVQNALEAVKAGGDVDVTVRGSDQKIQSSKFHVQGAETLNFEPGTMNAIAATQPSPLSIVPRPHFETAGCVITVADTGPGIPAEIRPHIFDPFFSGREAGRGLGLGLSKAWRIVELHGGAIDVASGVERGARFDIVLPGG